MTDKRAYTAYTAAVIVGAVLWLVSAKISGRREPWDSAFYWQVSYPIAIVLSGVLGYAVPERPWRWSLAIMLSQFAAMAIKDDLGGLWPLGLVLFGALAVPGMGVAFFAARIRTGRTKG